MDPGLVLFAIQAGVKLGQKIHAVLIDETVEGPLLLPVGELFGDVQEGKAAEFFLLPEHQDLIRPGGPYFGLSASAKVKAYKTLLAMNDQLHDPLGTLTDAMTIIRQLHAFEQVKQEFGANTPWHRLLGTLVEIGIDYFTANPQALGHDSAAQRVVQAFVQSLDGTDFAEGSRTHIVEDIFGAALHTLAASGALVDDEPRVQVLLGSVTKALLAEVDAARSEGAKVQREALFRRIGPSLLRGGVGAFAEHLDLYILSKVTLHTVITSTLTQVFAGLQGVEDLGPNASLELLFKSALGAVSTNVTLFTEQPILQEIIAQAVKPLLDPQGQPLFAESTISAILHEALAVLQDNITTLLDPDDPQHRWLIHALAAVTQSVTASLARNTQVKDLLSGRQLSELIRITLQEVTRYPGQLLGELPTESTPTVVTQILTSVVQALGEHPARLVHGSGVLELVRVALQVTAQNVDKFTARNDPDPQAHLLFDVLQQLVAAVSESSDARQLVTREVFVEMARRVLPVVSADLEVIVGGAPAIVADTVRQALLLASGALRHRINGANFPVLIAQLLHAVLWEDLSLAEPAAVELAAKRLLKAA